ncbi:MAG: DUF4398 domain-containing protein [Spirochaetes bacterium]|nr:DUF4398 domain-containing protein [Spirochaetota bacterium]
MKKITLYIAVVCIVGAIGCASDLPIKDMSKARYGITQAQEVKAEKYAPEELEKAKQYLYDTHSLIKEDKIKDAKQKSVESQVESQKAIEKSLPLYASDMLAQATESLQQAEMLNAKEFASVEYAQAVASLNEATQLTTDKSYRQSIQKSKEAIGFANDAKAKSIAMIPQLKEQLIVMENEKDSLRTQRGDEFAKNELIAAEQKLSEASTKLEEQNIVAAIAAMQAAKESLSLAKTAIEKGKALESLEAAKSLYTQVSERESSQEMAESLTEAEKLIANSQDQFSKENYIASYDASQQAITVLNSLLIAMEKKEEALALQEETKEQVANQEPKPEYKEYIVQYNPNARDCLWRIALKVYNNARLWPLIYIANKDQIKDPDLIFPGQRFVIPSLEKEKAQESTEAKTKLN